jgi:hypothetical protein
MLRPNLTLEREDRRVLAAGPSICRPTICHATSYRLAVSDTGFGCITKITTIRQSLSSVQIYVPYIVRAICLSARFRKHAAEDYRHGTRTVPGTACMVFDLQTVAHCA